MSVMNQGPGSHLSGRGGAKITEIRRLSGSRISIAKVPHDETGERMFTIVGTQESTEKALMLLYSQLESEKERREPLSVGQSSASNVNRGPAVRRGGRVDDSCV